MKSVDYIQAQPGSDRHEVFEALKSHVEKAKQTILIVNHFTESGT
ncbi:MAG: hypothetical protein U0670_17670 [Anaerolineae bacterium]